MVVRFCAGIGDTVTSTGLAGGGPGRGGGGGGVCGTKFWVKVSYLAKISGKKGAGR
jgi:hypothetical protein